MRDERSRRQSASKDVLALLESRPGVWVSWQEIARVGGSCAWRTRISDARKIAERRGARIEWNKNIRTSSYRYLPYQPIGRDAAMPTQQPRLI